MTPRLRSTVSRQGRRRVPLPLVSANISIPSRHMEQPTTDPTHDLPFAKELTVAIVTRNRAQHVIESLRAVSPQLSPGDDLLVVDDGSDDGSAIAVSVWIREHLPEARFVATAYRGVSAARNTALAEARSATVCFIDDDATACEDWLAELRSAWLSASPRIAVIGGPIRPDWQSRPPWLVDELLYVVSVLDHGTSARQLTPGTVCYAANMSVRRSTVLEVGGFDSAWGYAPGRIGGRGSDTLRNAWDTD